MGQPTGQHLGRVIRDMVTAAQLDAAGHVAQVKHAAHRERLEEMASEANRSLRPMIEAVWGPLLDAGELPADVHALIEHAAGRPPSGGGA